MPSAVVRPTLQVAEVAEVRSLQWSLENQSNNVYYQSNPFFPLEFEDTPALQDRENY
jgi:hypothetical protein